MKIRKMQTASGGSLFPWLLNTEWVYNWKFRTTPASRSRVLSGKGVETDKQYTERRKKETTKRTWRSDAADIAHGIGEGVLALHPYTAIPYFGAKVVLDFLNGTYGWHTALNASVPLFHLAPQTVGLKEATNVALEDAANAGSKTARNWRVAREINLATKNKPNIEVSKPIIRTKVGDVEIDNPQLAYRLGPTVAEDFNRTGIVTPPKREAEIVQAIPENASWLDKLNIRLRQKTFNNPMFAQGRLWYKSPVESFGSINSIGNAKQQQLIVTAEPLRVASKTSAPINKWSDIGGTFDVRDTGPLLNFDRRIPITESQLGPHNLSLYIWKPGYGYKKIAQEPSTSLKFFERKPVKSVTREYVQSPKDVTSDVGDLIAEGSERSVYTSKSNPNIVYKIEDGNAPLEDINNIKIRSEINDDIIAPETTIGYYKHKNGKYYRVTQQDKHKSYDPDNFYEEISPELNLEIIKTLEKAGWKVNIENGHVTTASKNGTTIGNLEHFNWGRDSKGNLKLIDLYVVKKQGGKMNIIEFLKNGSGIHIKEKNRGKFTKSAKAAGLTVQEHAKSVLNDPNATPLQKKRANFARNAAKWKHEKGGIIKAQQGTKTTTNNFLNSDFGLAIVNGGLNLLQTGILNELTNAQSDASKAQNKLQWNQAMKLLIKQNQNDRNNQYLRWVLDYLSGRQLDRPSLIVAQHMGYLLLNLDLAEGKNNLDVQNSLIDYQTRLKTAQNWGNAIEGVLQEGLKSLSSYLNNKKSTNSSTTNSFWTKPSLTSSTTNSFWNNSSLTS